MTQQRPDGPTLELVEDAVAEGTGTVAEGAVTVEDTRAAGAIVQQCSKGTQKA